MLRYWPVCWKKLDVGLNPVLVKPIQVIQSIQVFAPVLMKGLYLVNPVFGSFLYETVLSSENCIWRMLNETPLLIGF